jgi:hypothetical protein
MADIINISFKATGETKTIATYVNGALDEGVTEVTFTYNPQEHDWIDHELVRNGDGTGSIKMTALANDDEVHGRSVELTISYQLGENPCGATLQLCQPNKRGDTPVPPVTDFKTLMIMNDGTVRINCGENPSELSKTELENAHVTIANVKDARFGSCITKFTGFTFSGNEKLTACTFADDIAIESIPGSFFKGTKIKTIKIPSKVETIGGNAFSGCSQLTSYTISNDNVITTIGNSCFSNCAELKNAIIPDGLSGINQYTFSECSKLESINIPSGIQSIGQYAFQSCSAMTAVTFENDSKLETIGDSSFQYCTSIKSLKIPKTVKTIGSNAFGQKFKTDPTQYVTSLTSLTFDSGSVLETIGGGAFKYASGITSVAIPNTVKTIGYEAFAHTSSLTSLTFGNNSVLETLANICFEWASIKSITFPKTLKTIGDGAFQSNHSLTSITFESGSELKTIGGWAFDSCCIKGNITLPEGLTTIGLYAFASNEDYETPSNSLTSVTIPSSVTSMAHGTFYACHRLKTATIKAVNPPDFVPGTGSDEWIFHYGPNVSCDLEHVYVPSGSVTAYKNARGFQNVKDIITEIQ